MMLLDPLVMTVLSLCFALLYVHALQSKLLHFKSFRSVLNQYVRGVIPADSSLVLGLALLVIGMELVALVACLSPIPAILRSGLIALPLLLYAAAMAINLKRGNSLLDCGCAMGRDRQPVSAVLVYRNLALAAIAAMLALPAAPRNLGAFDIFAALVATGSIAVAYATFHSLLTQKFSFSE